MQFVINGMKYNTENMEKVAEVKKWYREDNVINRAMFPGREVGRIQTCELWKSAKGNWLLTRPADYGRHYGESIQEEEAKDLLMRCATHVYETMYGELPEA